MKMSRERLVVEAEATGFRPDVLEKVVHLLGLLDAIRSHPYLKGKLVLKGGTALNLFLFDVPRLSVDIDLNYVGARDREKMLEERPRIEEALQAVFSREGFSVRRMPEEHAGGKWFLRYESALGQNANIEVDLNFMFRVPLWPIQIRDSCLLGSYQVKGISVLDYHELAAGKLAALLARNQSRDLFDSHRILEMENLDPEKLRLAFVVYGGMNRRDWRTVSVEDVQFDARELAGQLAPMLRFASMKSLGNTYEYGSCLHEECRRLLSVVLPFNNAEQEFLDLLLDKGEIAPSLLSDDPDFQERIGSQPLLQWKAAHVRKHKGTS